MHLTGGSLRDFRQFTWLEVVSDKMALSRPAHQQVTQTVGRLVKLDPMTFLEGGPYGG